MWSCLRPVPEEPGEACAFYLGKILDALKEAKILPVMLAGLKHQENLRSLSNRSSMHAYPGNWVSQVLPPCHSNQGDALVNHCSELENSFHQLAAYDRQALV